MGARDLIESGTWKKVGNGKSIKIWEDCWIPANQDGKVTTVKPISGGLTMVDELILGHRWNTDLIFRTFNSQDAMKILQIPLSLSGRKDCNFWKMNGDENYTVKSGYKELSKQALSQTAEHNGVGESSLTRTSNKIWKKMWKLKVKEKIKHFIQNCVNGALPVRAHIFSRTKKGHPFCKGCGEHAETVEHAMITCARAQEVWKMAPIQWEGVAEQAGSFKHWWWNVMDASSRTRGQDHLSLTANILLQLWKARNDREFNDKHRHPMKIVQIAHQEWLELDEVVKSIQTLSRHETRNETKINEQVVEKEDRNVLHLAMHQREEGHKVGMGVVLSDPTNKVLEIWAMKERSTGDSLLDQAMSVRLILAKARNKQWKRVKIHIQYQQLLEWLSSGKSKIMGLATLFDDVQNLKALFHKCSFGLNLDRNCISQEISMFALGIDVDEEWKLP